MGQELSRREEVMPMCPATLADRLFCVVTAYDRLGRYKTFCLPAGEAFSKELQHTNFAFKVSVGRRSVTTDFLDAAIGMDDSFNPSDAVEPLLKNIARPGHEVIIGPAS